MAATIAYDGPAKPYPFGELVHRERIEVGVDALLALNPVLGRALERLSEIPLVGTMASRFMGRIVGEVLQANQAVANRVPGLGSLMSFGTGAASKVVGAADKPFEALVGVSVGKGGAFAVGRLNRILMETLRDPTTRDAVLQVWDLMAQEPVAGLGSYAPREQIYGVVDAVHDLAITILASEHCYYSDPRSPPYWPDREPRGGQRHWCGCRSDDAAGSLTHVTAMPIIRPCRPVDVASHSAATGPSNRRRHRLLRAGSIC